MLESMEKRYFFIFVTQFLNRTNTITNNRFIYIKNRLLLIELLK